MNAKQTIPINTTGTMMIVITAMENSSVTGSTIINSINLSNCFFLYSRTRTARRNGDDGVLPLDPRKRQQ